MASKATKLLSKKFEVVLALGQEYRRASFIERTDNVVEDEIVTVVINCKRAMRFPNPIILIIRTVVEFLNNLSRKQKLRKMKKKRFMY